MRPTSRSPNAKRGARNNCRDVETVQTGFAAVAALPGDPPLDPGDVDGSIARPPATSSTVRAMVQPGPPTCAGDEVQAGQRIARVGRLVGINAPSDMLHIEVYDKNATGDLTVRDATASAKRADNVAFGRRRDLVDPTQLAGAMVRAPAGLMNAKEPFMRALRPIPMKTCNLHALLFSSLIVAQCVLLAKPAAAQAPAPKSFWSLYWENDTFYDTDRSYTNGVKVLRMSSLDGMADHALLPDAFLRRHFDPDCGRDPDSCWDWLAGWAAVQMMYTPVVIDNTTIATDDRPFGGWLYASRTFTASRPSQGDQVAQEHTIEMSVGVSGNASLADETQKFVHKHIAKGAATPRGWGNQIPTEPVVNASYSHRRRLWEFIPSERRVFDLIPEVGGMLGTAFTYANAGLTARLGLNLGDDFGPIRTVPVAARMNTGGRSLEVYLLGSVNGRVVARNMFLQGGVFRDAPHTVTPERLVGDADIAVVARLSDYALSFRWVRRTPEFQERAIWQSYGVLNLIVLH